jgi:hypothetical protein
MLTIKFGLDNQITKPDGIFTYADAVLADRNIQAALGFGADGFEALVNGAPDSGDILPNGSVIQIVPAAAKKG